MRRIHPVIPVRPTGWMDPYLENWNQITRRLYGERQGPRCIYCHGTQSAPARAKAGRRCRSRLHGHDAGSAASRCPDASPAGPRRTARPRIQHRRPSASAIGCPVYPIVAITSHIFGLITVLAATIALQMRMACDPVMRGVVKVQTVNPFRVRLEVIFSLLRSAVGSFSVPGTAPPTFGLMPGANCAPIAITSRASARAGSVITIIATATNAATAIPITLRRQMLPQ